MSKSWQSTLGGGHIDKDAERDGEAPSRGGETGVARLDWKGFGGGRSGGESSCGRLVRQKEQEKKERWWWWWWRILEKYMIERAGKGNTETLYIQVNYKPKKKKSQAVLLTCFFSWPSDITWRIKCFSSCGRVFHPETAIENLAKKSC